MKVHNPKLYNMAHLLALSFTASKGSNNYFYFNANENENSGFGFLSVISDPLEK